MSPIFLLSKCGHELTLKEQHVKVYNGHHTQMMPHIALKTFNDQFPRKCPKTPIFDTQSPLIPRLRFFPNMAPHSNDTLYCPLPSCKKLETYNDRFPRKRPKT